jgi:hypothetical protein
MSALALDIERPAMLGPDIAGRTLEDVVSRAWAAIRAGRPAPCPVCHGAVVPGRFARCRDCGSTLS